MATNISGNSSEPTGSNDTGQGGDISFYFYTKDQEIIITIVMPILLALGLILNFAFLYVVAKVQSMRTVTNYYLVNLAIADCLYITFAVADKLVRFYDSPIVFDQTALGRWGCIMVYGVTDIAYYVSLFTVVLFTVERFIAITFPLRAQMMSSKKRTLVLIFITWVVGVTFSLPAILANSNFTKWDMVWPAEYSDMNLPSQIHTCYETNGPLTYAGQIINVFPFFISMVAVTILNAVICLKIARDNKGVGESQRSKSSIKARNQVVRMLVVTSMLFFLLLFPFEFAAFAPIFDPDSDYGIIPPEIYSSWVQVSRILSYINSAINPVVYNAMSARYRTAFFEAFCCGSKANDKARSNSTTYTTGGKSSVYSKSETAKVGNNIPIEPVSCDSARFNSEDTVVTQTADNKDV